MCGIAGIWLRNGGTLHPQVLGRFNDSMAHRGPDGHGQRIFGTAMGIAHRRLSILDTSESGAQPMADSTGRYHITFNGEVFNFLELRRELEAKGEQFHSESDTEVILAAYRCWGMEAFHRFNGMWAIAIWDEQEQELLLCRDRFGIKPLYYLNDTGVFAFASETNAFKHLDSYTRRVHAQRMQIGLEDTYALEGRGYTLYEDIYQLLPGHFIRLSAKSRVQQRRWYHINESKVKVLSSYQEQVEAYRELFQEACVLRMRSDVPLATALSGGVDSTAVYSMVHRLMQEQGAERVPADWQRAFVAVFPGTVQDETIYAKQAVAHTGGKAVYLDPSNPQLVDEVLSTTKAFDAISSTPILALMTVYKGMRAHGVTVSLDGHGVDEMLYGYRSMVYDAFEYHKWHGSREDAHETAQVLVGLYPPEDRQAKLLSFENDSKNAFARRSGFLSSVKSVVKKMRRNDEPLKPRDLLSPLSDKPYEFGSFNVFDRMVHEEFFVQTLPSLLRNFDKASMMSSVEIRMPFMDYRIVESSFALPLEAKLGGGYTKRILRDAMEGIMPDANRTRTFKVGLAAPTMEWFQGPLREFVSDIGRSSSFVQSQYWDRSVVSGIEEHIAANDWTVPSAAQAWKYINAQLILDA